MLPVRYGINLAPEIKENKIDIIKNEPFTVWDGDCKIFCVRMNDSLNLFL
ncbi:hypothetical protein [Lactobacillus crispatus]|nr:hypothetical protein [Lactobacillus crispatus]